MTTIDRAESAGRSPILLLPHYFLTLPPPFPIVSRSRHLCLNEAVVSCRVAEGNGPAEATTTGSGNSLIIWCQFPPGLRGT